MAVVSRVIVGDVTDAHVERVVRLLPVGGTAIFDLTCLEKSDYCLSSDGLEIQIPKSIDAKVKIGSHARGWLRRLGPPDWQDGIVLGSREAANKAAWATLLAAIVRSTSVEWLTKIDDLNRAENKFSQYKAAMSLGIPTPHTIVTSDSRKLASIFGESVVLKPLGPGHFTSRQGTGNIVFTAGMQTDDPRLKSLAGAPFIAQQLISSAAHLRVVTVGNRIWGCEIEAATVPLDWRRQPAAHRAFKPTKIGGNLAEWAKEICSFFRLGYSSQDWIIDTSGKSWLVDINPSGQWLFLPEPVASEVAHSIAGWLNEGEA